MAPILPYKWPNSSSVDIYIYICKLALPTQYDKYYGKNYCGAAEKEITDCA